VSVEAGAWETNLADLDRLCRIAVAAALEAEAPAIAPRAEVGVLLTDDDAIRALNRAWRGRDRATNVLSFPAQDPAAGLPEGNPILLGDVVVAYGTLAREAVEAGRPLAHHLQHLLVHGTLHLLGHDHAEAAAAERMERREVEVLAALGVPDPYAGELAA
jgi:probable rRNA maturation factor